MAVELVLGKFIGGAAWFTIMGILVVLLIVLYVKYRKQMKV
jgi:LPXTG-motif cell wall-anchored protein